MKFKQGERATIKTDYGTFEGEVSRVSWKTREVWLKPAPGAHIQKISFDDIPGW